MKYVLLLSFLLSGCSATWYCTKWETVPTGTDCAEWDKHPQDPFGRDVCMFHRNCYRCIEKSDDIVLFSIAPVQACEEEHE